MSRVAATQEQFRGPDAHMNGATKMCPSHYTQGAAFTQPQGGEPVQQGPMCMHLRNNRAVSWGNRVEGMHEGCPL